MRWSEIDFAKKIWTVPASRMKAGREHRVPLSPRAFAMLRQLERLKAGDFVFPGQKSKSPFSGRVLHMVLRKFGVKGATVHGFRSSFRDWAGSVSNFPREITETALAHVIGDRTSIPPQRRAREAAQVDGCLGCVLRAKRHCNIVQIRKPSP
jgi:integrase